MYGVTEDTEARDDLEYYHLTPKQRLEQTKKIMNFTGVKEIYILNIDHRLEYYYMSMKRSLVTGIFCAI